MIGAANVKWLMSADIKYQSPKKTRGRVLSPILPGLRTDKKVREESKGLGQCKKEFMEHYQNHVTFKLGFYNLVVDTENLFFIVDKLRF